VPVRSFWLATFADNFAPALFGATFPNVVFRGKVHIGYLAAIVAASNAGGSGSVVGDTTTTMMWIAGVNPLQVLDAYVAAGLALVIFGIPAAFQQHRHSPISQDAPPNIHIDWMSVAIVATILLVFTLMLADFFDTMGTMTAIGAEAGLNDEEGTPPHAQRILVVDSVAAIAGGAGGVSSNTSYIESASGVGEGARTGLASVVTGVLFLLATFFTPLVSAIPSEAAVPALVLVGFLMMQQVSEIDWRDVELAIPAFLTVVLMPFTYSISVGIGAGFVAFVLIKVVVGKAREVHPLMWVVAALFVLYFAYTPINGWLS